MKRFTDFIAAVLAAFVLFIPFVLVAIAIKLTSEGPVLHWSSRVGKNNFIFRMPKFRSMKIDTPDVATDQLKDPDGALTSIGGFLRKTSLDEIPQLWSILVGDMSFVGPRPALYNQEDLIAMRTEKSVHTLVPGLTGWAQVNGRDGIPLWRKVELDAEYMERQSFWFDLFIIWQTAVCVVRRAGVAH